MNRTILSLAGSCVTTLVLATGAAAQQPQQGAGQPLGLAVGEVAPDFAIPGATRYGLLRDPIRLSDFRGQAVVIAFFPRARTKG
jgi:thioredoxin-dependent peroxiredoxin